MRTYKYIHIEMYRIKLAYIYTDIDACVGLKAEHGKLPLIILSSALRRLGFINPSIPESSREGCIHIGMRILRFDRGNKPSDNDAKSTQMTAPMWMARDLTAFTKFLSIFGIWAPCIGPGFDTQEAHPLPDGSRVVPYKVWFRVWLLWGHRSQDNPALSPHRPTIPSCSATKIIGNCSWALK